MQKLIGELYELIEKKDYAILNQKIDYWCANSHALESPEMCIVLTMTAWSTVRPNIPRRTEFYEICEKVITEREGSLEQAEQILIGLE